MLAQPILIDRETIRKADWQTIGRQMEEIYESKEEITEGFANLLDFAESCGVKRNAADKMLKRLSTNRMCKIGVMFDKQEIRFA